MSTAKRGSKVEKERRILTVQGWLIDGVQDWLILQQMQSEWDLSLRQSRRYLKDAYTRWKANEDISIEHRRAAKIAELKQDKRSLKPEYKGTPQGINAIARLEKLIIRLEDLEPPRKHQVEANVSTTIKPTKYIDATGDSNTSA